MEIIIQFWLWQATKGLCLETRWRHDGLMPPSRDQDCRFSERMWLVCSRCFPKLFWCLGDERISRKYSRCSFGHIQSFFFKTCLSKMSRCFTREGCTVRHQWKVPEAEQRCMDIVESIGCLERSKANEIFQYPLTGARRKNAKSLWGAIWAD